MTATEETLARRVLELEHVESRFAELLHTGRLCGWQPCEVRLAVDLSLAHKLAAIRAIEQRELLVAINNLDAIIYLISGFVREPHDEDLEPRFN